MKTANDTTHLESILKKRVINKELYIKNLINKYLELMNLYDQINNSETNTVNSDIENSKKDKLILEIQQELDNVELQILKAKTCTSLSSLDEQYQSLMENKINFSLSNFKSELNNNKEMLSKEYETRASIIECEEIAKVINNYKNKNELKQEISELEEENLKLEEELLAKSIRLQHKSAQINLVIELIEELKQNEN